MATVSSLFREGLKPQSGDTIEIDFSGLEKVDSSAVSLMLAWMREAQLNKASLRFTNVPDNLSSLAKLYGVAELLTLVSA